eukprot:Nk52_evm1s485 gene=Nk52_evmTU1s485
MSSRATAWLREVLQGNAPGNYTSKKTKNVENAKTQAAGKENRAAQGDVHRTAADGQRKEQSYGVCNGYDDFNPFEEGGLGSDEEKLEHQKKRRTLPEQQ